MDAHDHRGDAKQAESEQAELIQPSLTPLIYGELNDLSCGLVDRSGIWNDPRNHTGMHYEQVNLSRRLP